MAYRANGNHRSNDRVSFEVIENIGVLGRKESGWTREVNLVSWNGAPAKVDIREWDPGHERMAKGITLHEAEAELLARMLAVRYGIMAGSPAAAVGESVSEEFKEGESAHKTSAASRDKSTEEDVKEGDNSKELD